MDAKSFFELVAQMRQAQKRFFENPRFSKERMEAYSDSKFLEARVDAEILRVKNVMARKESTNDDA